MKKIVYLSMALLLAAVPFSCTKPSQGNQTESKTAQADSENPEGENPGGENPGGGDAGGENPGGENPGGENPGGENPGGENPGGENPGGENPGGDNPGGETGDQEWDGKTFVDRTAEWHTEFVDHGGWWSYDITSCTAKYHLIKYIQEGDAALGFPAEVCKPDADIARVYQFFCVDVDYDPYLINAMTDKLPDLVELLWPDGGGRAHGYVFGFNEKKQFTGEYVHLASEKVF